MTMGYNCSRPEPTILLGPIKRRGITWNPPIWHEWQKVYPSAEKQPPPQSTPLSTINPSLLDRHIQKSILQQTGSTSLQAGKATNSTSKTPPPIVSPPPRTPSPPRTRSRRVARPTAKAAEAAAAAAAAAARGAEREETAPPVVAARGAAREEAAPAPAPVPPVRQRRRARPESIAQLVQSPQRKQPRRSKK